MLDAETPSLDARAIVLTCSSLGLPRGAPTKPFGPRGWARIADRLSQRGGEPGSLLAMTDQELGQLFDDPKPDDADRLGRLLARSGQLGFELDRLASLGIWVRTLADAGYPSRLRTRLGPDAPPVLFGAGETSLLERGGVGIVGSRDVDDDGADAARHLAAAVARGNDVVVSGGARGVDQVSMAVAFEAGGSVVGVLPEGVERRIREASTRQALADGVAAVVSPYHPGAGFSAGAAMARNKIVYGLSDVTVVIDAVLERGGTWTGAVEALEAGWVPVLVRTGSGRSTGNAALVARGGRPIDIASIGDTTTADALLTAAGPSIESVAEVAAPYEQQELTLTE
jgi:predicted Rossmann fold nucleotide-binding protein DprA/Smf involved in DNA uptake